MESLFMVPWRLDFLCRLAESEKEPQQKPALRIRPTTSADGDAISRMGAITLGKLDPRQTSRFDLGMLLEDEAGEAKVVIFGHPVYAQEHSPLIITPLLKPDAPRSAQSLIEILKLVEELRRTRTVPGMGMPDYALALSPYMRELSKPLLDSNFMFTGTCFDFDVWRPIAEDQCGREVGRDESRVVI